MANTADSNEEPTDDDSGDSPSNDDSGSNRTDGSEIYGQQIRHRQLSARVPDSIGSGVFTTGAIVLTGASEFVVDFLVRMARPYQVSARIVMPHAALIQLIRALDDNIGKYENRFGEIPAMPKADPNARRPSIQEVYDDLKIPDEGLSGVYANACIIGHSPAEFVFDFVTNFFPRSAVSSRVYMSTRQVPQFLKGMRHAAAQLEQRRKKAQQQGNGGQAKDDSPPNPDEEDKQPGSDSDLMY